MTIDRQDEPRFKPENYVPVLVPRSMSLATVARALASEGITLTYKDGNLCLEMTE